MKLIVACDPTGGIGYNNKLPWSKIEGDLPRFKKLTENGIVVMGRNTYLSIGSKPLPNRTNIVISNTFISNDVLVLPNIGKLKNADNVWLIGGAKLIESLWDNIHEVHLTRVLTEYTCDTFINLLTLDNDFINFSTEIHDDHSYEVWKRKCNNITIY